MYEDMTTPQICKAIIQHTLAMDADKGSADVSEFYMPTIDALKQELGRRQQEELDLMLSGMTPDEKAVCMRFYRLGGGHMQALVGQ